MFKLESIVLSLVKKYYFPLLALILLNLTSITCQIHIGKWIGPNHFYYQRLKYWSSSSNLDFDNHTSTKSYQLWPSKQCKNDLDLSLRSMNDNHQWALSLFQSWARIPPSGIFLGTLTDYGDYDQCLSIDQRYESSPITPQYCLIDLSIPMPKPMPLHHNLFHRMRPARSSILNLIYQDQLEDISSTFYYTNLQFGICVPKSCTENDVAFIAQNDAEKIGLELKKLSCESRPAERWYPNLTQKIAIITLVVILSLSMAATLLDDKNEILKCFSPIINCRKLFAIQSSSTGNDELSCIHGLRVLTICWIMMGHTLDWNNLNVFRNTFNIKDELADLPRQLFYRTHFSVETFFYITGLLTSYITLGHTKGNVKNFNSFAYIFFRYLRLTPQLIIFMLLTSLLPDIYDGPLWKMYNDRIIGQCHRTWWHNLIYMQNIIDNENICAIHTWFLAADMQLHWLSLIPILIVLKNRKIGLYFAKFLITLFTLICSLIIYYGQLPPGYVVTTKSDFLDEFGKPSALVQFFHKPWNHTNVFFVGFVFGAYLYENLGKISSKIQLNMGKKLTLWLLVVLGYLVCIYSNSFYLYGRPYKPIISALIFPLNRLLWSFVLTLIIWLCISGNGMLVGKLLSWPALRPLSRMTFSVYLVHAWTFVILIGTKRDLIDIHILSILFLFLSMITTSYIYAFFFTILFESPFIHLMAFAKKSILMAKLNNERIKLNNSNNSDTDNNSNEKSLLPSIRSDKSDNIGDNDFEHCNNNNNSIDHMTKISFNQIN